MPWKVSESRFFFKEKLAKFMKNNTKEAFRKTTLALNEGWKREVNLFRIAKNLRLVSYRKNYSPFWKISIELKNFKVNSTTSVFFHSRTGLEQFRFPLYYPLSQIVLKLLIDCQATARTNTNRKENSLQFRKMIEKIEFIVQNCVFTSKCTCNCSDFWQLVKPNWAAAVSWRFLRMLNQGVSIQGWHHF